MSVPVIALIVALLGGLAIGFQNPLASLMGQKVGILESAFIVHLGGTALAGLLILVVPGGQLAAWRAVPWYALGAGALGVALISAVTFSIPKIGVSSTLGLVLAAQLVVAAWLDHNGYLGAEVHLFDAQRMLGMVLLVAGAWLLLR